MSKPASKEELMKILSRLIAEYEEQTGEEINIIKVHRKVEKISDGRERVNIDVTVS